MAAVESLIRKRIALRYHLPPNIKLAGDELETDAVTAANLLLRPPFNIYVKPLG